MLNAAGAGGKKQRQNHRRYPALRSRRLGRRQLEDPPDAVQELSAAGCGNGNGQSRRPPGLELRQRLRISDAIAAHSNRHIVATVFAFGPNPVRQPPDRGVIKEKRLRERLEQIDGVVVTADVRQLVRENRLDLRRRQRCHRCDRKKNDRAKAPDQRRDVDEPRLDHMRGRRETHLIRNPAAGPLPGRCLGGDRDSMQRPHAQPASGHSREQQHDA